MRVRHTVLCVLSLLVLSLAIGCSKPEAPKTEAPPAAPPAAPAAAAPAAGGAEGGKALFELKCGVCHGLDRAFVRAETREKWAGIIKDMQGKKGDWISDADAAKILDYLVAEHGKK
jgi:cytochrome c5